MKNTIGNNHNPKVSILIGGEKRTKSPYLE